MVQRKRESGGSASELTRLSLLTAIARIIFIVEQQVPFPLPIPGAKLGLANIITVYAVNRCRSGEVLLLVLARIFLGSLFAGLLTGCGVGLLILFKTNKNLKENIMILTII